MKARVICSRLIRGKILGAWEMYVPHRDTAAESAHITHTVYVIRLWIEF